ncbi:mab-21 domain-containing protein [Caerostris extrusa]|uniref:Mab-21 domain-containing protein n=1 Tax=Caerostris extrusa TaxID=172846 RepID=A0AAV4XR67_CAEEX|nr:mab-21 domain-containing protein [Caerostris extrusa]
MYERDYKTGSSYTDLRISEASEYDIDIVLKTPSEIRLEVEFFEATRAFSKIKWSKVSDLSENKMEVLKFLQKNSVDGYVDPVKMTSWLQGLIDVYLKTEPIIPGVKLFKNTQSGPARTIELVTNEDYTIHIDLVPVFMFSNSVLVETPIKSILDTYPAKKKKSFWFLVPKQCRGEEKLLASDCKLSWRCVSPK